MDTEQMLKTAVSRLRGETRSLLEKGLAQADRIDNQSERLALIEKLHDLFLSM